MTPKGDGFSIHLSRASRAFVDYLVQEVDEYHLLAQAGTYPPL
jgi:hypothetical protein